MTGVLLTVCVGAIITGCLVLAEGIRGWGGGAQPPDLPETQPMRAGYRLGRHLRIRRDDATRSRLTRNRQEHP